MNFNHLRVFQAVAENLSYTQAAEKLFVSQSTVSIQIKKLEEELEVDLFEQFGKKIYLTEAGERLFTYTNRIFSLVVDAKLALRDLKGLNMGKLVIGASTTPGSYILPTVIGSFQEKYPNIDISLEISNTHQVQKKILANKLDFGVVGEEFIMDPLLEVEPLLDDELVVIVPKGHLLAERQSITSEELLQHRFILRERGSSTREVFEEKINIKDKTLKVALQLNSLEAIKQAVVANLRISIVSKFAAEREVAAGRLFILRLTDLELIRQINLVYHKDKKLSPIVKKFMGHLKS